MDELTRIRTYSVSRLGKII